MDKDHGSTSLGVSIHTSAREVTRQAVCQLPFFLVSIHTSAREVTILSCLMMLRSLCFNPHFRKGSDCPRVDKYYCQSTVSIHTSAREVTLQFIPADKVLEVSIHTSAREVTKSKIVVNLKHTVSIHTSAREVTFSIFFVFGFLRVSIHTSAREVTLCSSSCVITLFCFNPHFRKGSDRVRSNICLRRACFNPHFRKGSDASAPYSSPSANVFQSTLPQGK